MGKQKLKTRVVKNNLNPEWNEELTLSIADPILPIKLHVYDRDLFSLDDKMGDAEFEIDQYLEAQKMQLDEVPSGTIITKVKPNRENCFSEESSIVWENGQVVQNMCLRLRNVECGEIETALKIYAKEGRLPILGSDANAFFLFPANAEFDALKATEEIGWKGVRNFVLCKKHAHTSSSTLRSMRKAASSRWRVWLHKSLSLKIQSPASGDHTPNSTGLVKWHEF